VAFIIIGAITVVGAAMEDMGACAYIIIRLSTLSIGTPVTLEIADLDIAILSF